MSRRPRQFFPPNTSPAHVALRAAAANARLNVDILREILAVINADCDLIAFAPICENLVEIIDFIDSVWHVNPSKWGLDDWAKVLDWVVENREQLKAHPSLGAKFDPANRELSPHQGYGVLRHPFYAMLWCTHASPQSTFRERYRLAQAQLLTGVIQALRKKYNSPAAWASMIDDYEAYSDRREWKPLANSIQAVSMLGRMLRSSADPYPDYLKWLPVEKPSDQFINDFFTIGYPAYLLNQYKLLSARHTCLRRFLDKLKGRRKFQARTSPNVGGRLRGHAEREIREIGNGLVGRELTFLDPSAADSGKTSVVHYTRCVKRSPSEIKEALDANDDPFAEEESTEDIYTVQPPERKKRNVSFTGWSQLRPMIMANQLLPYSFSNLAPAEAQSVLNEAEQWLSNHPSASLGNREMAKLETLGITLTMLATGSSLSQAHGLVVSPAGSESKDADLSLLLPDGAGTMATWRIAPVNLPYHFHPEETGKTQRTQSDYIFLPDVWGVDRFVRRLIEARSLKNNAWFDRLVGKRPFRIFRVAEKRYSEELRKFLNQVDPSGRITGARVAGFLFSRLMSATNGDVTLSALVAAQDLSLARARLFYACVRLRRIQDRYVTTLESVHRETPRRIPAWADKDLWITTRPCPTQEAVKDAIGRILDDLDRIDPYRSNDNYVTYHNLFTLYSLVFVFYATAQRGTNSPMPRPEQIDAQGFVWINDKDTGYNARTAWCPDALIKQVGYYAAHAADVRREVTRRHTDTTPSRRESMQSVLDDSCFLLKPDSKLGFVPVPGAKGAIGELLRGYLPFAINVHRRCVSGDLLDAGVDPQVVDWWMSHCHTGEEPWNTFSGLCPAQFAAAMKTPIEKLLLKRGLGFRAKPTALQIDDVVARMK